MVSVAAEEIEAVQAGITELLTKGTGGATGRIIWHVGPSPGQVTLTPELTGTPAQVCQAQAILLAASQGVSKRK